MYRERPFGLIVVEKLLGLIILLIGVFTINFTYDNMQVVRFYGSIFIAFGLALAGLGTFLLLAKTK
jgi:hypothetical protein